jgi:inner membrane transporter RhtA
MPSTERRRALGGTMLVVVSCSAVQGSAALSVPLFDVIAPAAAAAWRQAFGALVLLTFLRPRLRGYSGAEWATVGALGGAIATMNVAFYQAADRLPLGIAATLLYLGPFAVALVHTEIGWRLLLPVSALVGVVLVSRPNGDADPVGICVGLVSASALAAYTVTSQRLGRDGGLDRLALAVTVSAVILGPLSASSGHVLQPAHWLILVVSGVVGVGVAFTCDFTALKLAGTRVVSTLFALDPVIGAVIGAAVLSQHLTTQTVVGIAVIAFAGAVTTATRDKGPLFDFRHQPASEPRSADRMRREAI